MKSVLITEDDPIIAADLQRQLERAGYHVRQAYHSEMALRLALERAPDLVLMDVNLGQGPDGIDTASLLRASLPDLPIIYLTSNNDGPTFQRARATAPQGFLAKPFKGSDVLHSVALVLDRFAPPTLTRDQNPEADLPDHVMVRHGEQELRILVRDIFVIEAADYYCRLTTARHIVTVNKTLKRFLVGLPRPPFLRVHRSYAVNMDHVTAISEHHVHLQRFKVPVSRGKRAEVRRALGGG